MICHDFVWSWFSQRIKSVVSHLHRLLYVGQRILRLYVMEIEHFLMTFDLSSVPIGQTVGKTIKPVI